MLAPRHLRRQVPGSIAPQAAPRNAAAPSRGLFGEKYKAPKANWADKLGVVGGMLTDLSQGGGTANTQAAADQWRGYVEQQQAKFEEERLKKIRQAAALGDPQALAYLDPIGARNFAAQQSRNDVMDQRYAEEKAQEAARQAILDERYDAQRQNTLDQQAQAQANADRAYRASTAPPPERWQSAGDGVIFNNATGEMQGGTFDAGTGGFPDTGYMPPVDQNNGFILAAFGQDAFGNPTQDFAGVPYTYPEGGAQGGPDLPRINPNEYNKYRGSSLAKSDTEELSRAREYGRKFSVTIQPKLDTMKSMVEAGVPTGPMSPAVRGVGEVAPFLRGQFGIPDKEALGRADAFDSVAGQLVLDMASLAKGSMSDSDRKFFTTMAPQLTKTNPQMVIDAIERQGQRDQEYADGAELWSTRFGGLSMPNEEGKTFYQKWTEYASQNPIVPAQTTAEAEQAPIRIQDASGYASVPSGATYIAPDGITRRKR